MGPEGMGGGRSESIQVFNLGEVGLEWVNSKTNNKYPIM